MLSMNKKKKGFTLIELIVVIAILAILAAIAIPLYNSSRTKSANTAHNSNVRILEGAAYNAITNEGVPSSVITWTTGAGGGSTGSTHAMSNYIDKPQEILVPKGAKKGADALAVGGYTVTIGNTGTVSVTPEAVSVE